MRIAVMGVSKDDHARITAITDILSSVADIRDIIFCKDTLIVGKEEDKPFLVIDDEKGLKDLLASIKPLEQYADKFLVPSCWSETEPKYKKKNWKPEPWRK